jgi:hypothetical protein
VRVRIGLIVASLLASTPAHAEWWEAKTEHFIVYSESSQKDARDFATKMERLDMSLRSLQNTKFAPVTSDSHRLTVFRFGEIDDIGRLAGASFVAGFYIPRLEGSVSFTPAKHDSRSTGELLGARGRSSKTDLDPQSVLFHEYTHHFMFQNFSAAYPSWYVEAFAETAATIVLNDDGSFHLGNPPQYRSDDLFGNYLNVSIQRILANENKPTGEDQYAYYSVGWLLNHYLTFDPARLGQLKKYLTAINSGTKPADAARQTFGDLDKLNRDVMRYKGKRPLPGYDVRPANYSPPMVEMRRLTPDEEAVMHVKMRTKRGVDRKLAPGVARDARSIAQKYPNSLAAQLELAEAELDWSDFDPAHLTAAEAAVDQVLRIDPDSVQGQLIKGRIYLERGKSNKAQLPTARSWLAKAYAGDSQNPAPLFYNYLAYFYEGGAIPESALIGLEKAYDMALFDPELRLVLARQLLAEKKGALARSVLLPYAISPHESKGAKKMREVVDLIEAQKVDEAYKKLAGEMAEQERKRKAGDDD